MHIDFIPLVNSKRVKNAIFGLSLNFPSHGSPVTDCLSLQTAFCAAKRRWMRDTSKPRRDFIFDQNWSIFGLIGFLGHSTSVLNCALCYLKFRKITCSLMHSYKKS